MIRAADTGPRFRPVRAQRAFEEISAQIRETLSAGRLKPGDRLPAERDLAVQLGVSRNTLREALRLLEFSGLVRMRKGTAGGAFVREANGEHVVAGLRDLYERGAITPAHLTEARMWIETVVVRVACKRATRADMDALDANVAAAERAERADDIELRGRINLEFHRLLGRATRNPIMSIFMDAVVEILGHFVRVIGPYPNRFVLPSRRRFLKQFRARDDDGAAHEMEMHLRRLQRYYLSRLGTKTRRQAR